MLQIQLLNAVNWEKCFVRRRFVAIYVFIISLSSPARLVVLGSASKRSENSSTCSRPTDFPCSLLLPAVLFCVVCRRSQTITFSPCYATADRNQWCYCRARVSALHRRDVFFFAQSPTSRKYDSTIKVNASRTLPRDRVFAENSVCVKAKRSGVQTRRWCGVFCRFRSHPDKRCDICDKKYISSC